MLSGFRFHFQCTFQRKLPGSGEHLRCMEGWRSSVLARISILALARSQDTPPLRRIPRLFALNPAHHLRR